MLATRYRDTEHDPWPPKKHYFSPQKIPTQRMSNPYAASLPTHSEWQGHFGYTQQHEAVNLPSPFDRTHNPPDLRYPRPTMGEQNLEMDIQVKEESGSPAYPHTAEITSVTGPMKNTPRALEDHASFNIRSGPENTVTAMHSNNLPSPDAPSPVEHTENWSEQCGREASEDQSLDIKDEEDDGIEDEEEGEHDMTAPPMTAAERSAAKRKMKRFRYSRRGSTKTGPHLTGSRLTHQQTRFLMSEFVKQPHPDAAHRERLSREIPGLSPRQVQVWFQNR